MNIFLKLFSMRVWFAAFISLSIVFSAYRQPGGSVEALQNKSASFIKRYEKGLVYADETVSYQSMFDHMTESAWTGTVTLKNPQDFSDGHRVFHKRIFFTFYYYNNPAQVKKCYDSLIKCYPPACDKLEEGKNMTGLKTIPSIYIFNGNSIITCHINCMELTDVWEPLKKDMVATFAEPGSKIIISECLGGLNWIQPPAGK